MVGQVTDRFDRMDVEALRAECRRFDALINSPQVQDFLTGVQLEGAHQVERWGEAHDRGKTSADWFWLIGYLSQKAMTAELQGDLDKAKHHCISTAAALARWHEAIGSIGASDQSGGGS